MSESSVYSTSTSTQRTMGSKLVFFSECRRRSHPHARGERGGRHHASTIGVVWATRGHMWAHATQVRLVQIQLHRCNLIYLYLKFDGGYIECAYNNKTKKEGTSKRSRRIDVQPTPPSRTRVHPPPGCRPVHHSVRLPLVFGPLAAAPVPRRTAPP